MSLKQNISAAMSSLFVLIILSIPGVTWAQSDTANPKAEFQLDVSKNVHGVFMTCVDGCDFEVVKIDFADGKPRYMSEKGLSAVRDEMTMNESPFYFSIIQEGNTFKLQGLKGTGWKGLTFTCSDESCLTELNQIGVKVW